MKNTDNIAAKTRFVQALRENAKYSDEPNEAELAEINQLIDEEREIFYHKYIENGVLLAEKRLDEQGSDNLTRKQVKVHVIKNIKNLP